MSIDQAVFQKKKVQFEHLEDAGFVFSNGVYVYKEAILDTNLKISIQYSFLILDGDFEVRVQIDKAGQVLSQVFDLDLEEEYTAIHVPRLTGTFVGQVREAYLAVLEHLAETCFEALPFAKVQTNRLAQRIASEWDDILDYPFEKYPDYASYRIGGKWYALIFPLKLEKLGIIGNRAEEQVEVVNLKVDPADMENLLVKDGVFPSYHMSKRNWISLVLDGSLPDEEVWELVVKSRSLVGPKGYRSQSGPDFWVIPANPKYFDIEAEFAENKVVYWTQKAKIQKGDLVFMYVTAPVQAIRFVCRCLEAELDNTIYPDYPNMKKLMKVELIHTFDDSLFPFETMKKLGVRAVRGPRRMTKELIDVVKQELKDTLQDKD